MVQEATPSAACRLRNSREKRQQVTNYRRTHSPSYAEKLRINVCRQGPRSFAEYSCKPSFSLGLQSFLELVLHKLRIPRVSHRVHETDAFSDKQFDKTLVDGMHAVLGADLNQSRYLRKPPR